GLDRTGNADQRRRRIRKVMQAAEDQSGVERPVAQWQVLSGPDDEVGMTTTKGLRTDLAPRKLQQLFRKVDRADIRARLQERNRLSSRAAADLRHPKVFGDGACDPVAHGDAIKYVIERAGDDLSLIRFSAGKEADLLKGIVVLAADPARRRTVLEPVFSAEGLVAP